MNLQENINRIQSLMTEDKEMVIKNMIDKLGVSDTIKMVGDYYKIEPHLKVTDKINFIKEKVNEISERLGGTGFSLSEIGESPIFYDENEDELYQIEYLGSYVAVDVYNDNGGSHTGDFRVTYESLSVEIIEELVEILLNH